MKLPRIVIGAPRSGSGKTLISIALMKALSMKGKKVAAFKCGPDYIDPLFHKKILGVPSKNLDLFFTAGPETRTLFCNGNSSDISVVEGVMGLFDGLGGYTDAASTYELAEVLEAPVILVVNAKGMGRSILAELKGFIDYDRSRLIKGVILNNLSEMLYGNMKEIVEKELGVKVLGFFPPQKDLQLESRYLGLKLPHEIAGIQQMAEKAALELMRTVDVDAILELADSAPDFPVERDPADELESAENRELPVSWGTGRASVSMETPSSSDLDDSVFKELGTAAYSGKNGNSASQSVRIAIARDEAFCFYYEDNLRLLKNLGVELVEFSPIRDSALPPHIDGLILGGGYPELFAAQLEANVSMRKSIKTALDGGMPSLAECGGFMYLHEGIRTQDGVLHQMAGVVEGECSFKGKLVRFGYVTLTPETAAGKGWCGSMKAHEFHYFDSTDNGDACSAEKPVTGRNWKCCHVAETHWWGFPHLYYPSSPEFVEHFVEICRK